MGELSLALRSLAVESDSDVTKASAFNRNNVTYADEVSKVVADQNGTGAGSTKQNVKIVRATETEDLVFKDQNKTNR